MNLATFNLPLKFRTVPIFSRVQTQEVAGRAQVRAARRRQQKQPQGQQQDRLQGRQQQAKHLHERERIPAAGGQAEQEDQPLRPRLRPVQQVHRRRQVLAHAADAARKNEAQLQVLPVARTVRPLLRLHGGAEERLRQQLLPAEILGGQEREEAEGDAGRHDADVQGEGQDPGPLLGVDQLPADGDPAAQEQAGPRLPVLRGEHRQDGVEGDPERPHLHPQHPQAPQVLLRFGGRQRAPLEGLHREPRAAVGQVLPVQPRTGSHRHPHLPHLNRTFRSANV